MFKLKTQWNTAEIEPYVPDKMLLQAYWPTIVAMKA